MSLGKGKDKVKRLALVSEAEDGGFKAPHLELRESFVAKDSQVNNPAAGKRFYNIIENRLAASLFYAVTLM